MEDGVEPSKDDNEEALLQNKSCILRARGVFEQALNYLRNSAPKLKEERAMLLEELLNMEKGFGELGDVSIVQSKMPKKLKRKRPIANEDGHVGPIVVVVEENQTPNLQILQKALEWKKRRMVEVED